MKPTLIVAALLLALGVAQASDVFMTKDAQGRPVYTDRPDTLPAQRLDVKSASTDTVAVQQRSAEQEKQTLTHLFRMKYLQIPLVCSLLIENPQQ